MKKQEPAKIFIDLSDEAKERLRGIVLDGDSMSAHGPDDMVPDELQDAGLIDFDYSWEGDRYVGGGQLTQLGKRVSAFVMRGNDQEKELSLAQYISFWCRFTQGKDVSPESIQSALEADAAMNGGAEPNEDEAEHMVTGDEEGWVREELVDRFPSLVKLLSEEV